MCPFWTALIFCSSDLYLLIWLAVHQPTCQTSLTLAPVLHFIKGKLLSENTHTHTHIVSCPLFFCGNPAQQQPWCPDIRHPSPLSRGTSGHQDKEAACCRMKGRQSQQRDFQDLRPHLSRRVHRQLSYQQPAGKRRHFSPGGDATIRVAFYTCRPGGCWCVKHASASSLRSTNPMWRFVKFIYLF